MRSNIIRYASAVTKKQFCIDRNCRIMQDEAADLGPSEVSLVHKVRNDHGLLRLRVVVAPVSATQDLDVRWNAAHLCGSKLEQAGTLIQG